MVTGAIIALISFALGGCTGCFFMQHKPIVLKGCEVKEEPKVDPYKQFRNAKGLLSYKKYSNGG